MGSLKLCTFGQRDFFLVFWLQLRVYRLHTGTEGHHYHQHSQLVKVQARNPWAKPSILHGQVFTSHMITRTPAYRPTLNESRDPWYF